MRRPPPSQDLPQNRLRLPRAGAPSGGTFALGRGALGWMLVAVGDAGEVRAVFLADTPRELVQALQQRFPRRTWTEVVPDGGSDRGAAAAARALALVNRSIESPGRRDGGEPLLAPEGTPFQRRVWSELQALRVGECVSYGELARRSGCPRAVRAVAQACGANPIAVLIPCHRVVASDGALTGYHWGVERKRALLEREGVVPERRTTSGPIGYRVPV